MNYSLMGYTRINFSSSLTQKLLSTTTLMELRKMSKSLRDQRGGDQKKLGASTSNFVPLHMGTRPPMKKQSAKMKGKGKLRAQWNDEALKETIQAIDDGYTMEEVANHYGIPRTSLRDHGSGKTRSNKMNPTSTLTKEKELELIYYLEKMVDLGHSLNPSQLKA